MDDITHEMVIQVKDLVKTYGTLAAANGVSFTVGKGEIFGVLGPNGAGKTTTLETMIGMRQPTSGQVTVLGLDPYSQHTQMADKVCIQPQNANLFDHLTVAETLDLFGSFYTSPLVTDDVISDIGLEEKRNTLVKKLSGGQKQRLLVGVSLIGNGDVLFLDEPTGSLDPQARRQLWDVIRNLKDQGKTVILTTHSMEEAQALCDRLGIMHKGKMLAVGSPLDLINTYLPEQLIVYETTTKPDVAALERLPGVVNVLTTPSGNKTKIRIRTRRPEDTLRELLGTYRLAPSGGFRMEQGTLEDVFLALVGNGTKEGVA